MNPIIAADFLYLAEKKGVSPKMLLLEIAAVWVAEHRHQVIKQMPAESRVGKHLETLKIKDLIDSVLTQIESTSKLGGEYGEV